ncbi:MAG: hypothetical protein ABT00_08090 [Bordetella sp. SCN 68-11]|nr:MAG: hypothetical protein ABT00_08090 [Bordetella sp. SCN 68-11]
MMTNAQTSPLKDRMRRQELALCMALRQARTADISMMAAACGFDAIYVDMQHSTIGLDAVSALCTGALAAGIAPLVRLPGLDMDLMQRVLDGGAQGVLLPGIESADQARTAAQAGRSPSAGTRSVMGPPLGTLYRPQDAASLTARTNAETLMIMMLESPGAISRADEIAAVDGVDMLLIGSNDLCTAMGIPGQLHHPDLFKAYETVAAACHRHGKTLGIGGIRGDLALQKRLVALGASFLIAGSDVTYLMAAARKDAADIRQALAQPPSSSIPS